MFGLGVRNLYLGDLDLGNLRRPGVAFLQLKCFGDGNFRRPTRSVLFGDVQRHGAAEYHHDQSAHRDAQLSV